VYHPPSVFRITLAVLTALGGAKGMMLLKLRSNPDPLIGGVRMLLMIVVFGVIYLLLRNKRN
jgi:hypothetical protein